MPAKKSHGQALRDHVGAEIKKVLTRAGLPNAKVVVTPNPRTFGGSTKPQAKASAPARKPAHRSR